MTDNKVVLSTAGSREQARKIAESLVGQRLAACVNIIPQIESFYHWRGKMESAEEWLLVVKTSQQCFPRVRDAIAELHSYELPECICLSIEDGSAAYLDWITQALDCSAPSPRTKKARF